MRKEYSKPVVFAESFELTEHITGQCVDNGAQNQRHFSTRFKNAEDCAYKIYDGDTVIATYFLDGSTICKDSPVPIYDGSDPIDCYQGPNGIFTAFSS